MLAKKTEKNSNGVSACAAISRRRPTNGPSYDRLTLSKLLGSTPYSATNLPALNNV